MHDRLQAPEVVGVTLALDAVAVEVVAALDADDIPNLLLRAGDRTVALRCAGGAAI